MNKPESKDPLAFGGEAKVPTDVATCPECGAELVAVSEEWETETGKPAMSLLVGCTRFMSDSKPGDVCDSTDPYKIELHGHRHDTADWQPVNDKVQKWAGCVEL